MGPPSGVDSLPTPVGTATDTSFRVVRGIDSRPSRLISEILASKLSRSEKLSHLFVAGIYRSPLEVERRAAERLFIDAGPDKEHEVWLRIWSALTQSEEYRP